MLVLNWTYKFKFEEDFDRLNGVYKVVKIYSFNELLVDQVNLFEEFYSLSKNPITEAEFERDRLPIIRTRPIFKIESVIDANIVHYIPEQEITFAPDPHVNPYKDLILSWRYGACKEAEEIEFAKNQVNELVEGLFGSVDSPLTVAIGTVWLTDTEFQEIQNDRVLHKTLIMNFYKSNIEHLNTIAALRGRIQALEDIIKNHVANP